MLHYSTGKLLTCAYFLFGTCDHFCNSANLAEPNPTELHRDKLLSQAEFQVSCHQNVMRPSID
jgi:hypothetical protein